MATKKRSALASLHSVRFPNESAKYRSAREQLLREEIKLRRHVEEIASRRRQLPVGGLVPEDYVFEEVAADRSGKKTVRRVRLSQLFRRPEASLVIYSFMYGPKMAKPCPMCSAMLDSLNGAAWHADQRINLAVVAKSPVQRILTFARKRGWRNLRVLSSAGNTYNRDYGGETADGSQLPSLNVFVRHKGKIHHFYNTEMLFASRDPGQDPRHVDAVWPLWHLFDFTPEGRGVDWRPKLTYAR